MAYTLDHLRDLEEAFASGAREVRYEDRLLRFDSADQLLRRILVVRRELGLTSQREPRKFLSHSKGLDQ